MLKLILAGLINHTFLILHIIKIIDINFLYSDNPSLVFKTLAEITKRETTPNSDEEGE